MSLSLPDQTFVLLTSLCALTVACDLGGPADDDCFRGKCDGVSDVRSQLDGLDEPIADWLRESPMDRDGILETDYMSAMEQLAKFSDCGMDSLKTFVISDNLVTGKDAFPRLISTLCSDNETKASSIFVAASFSDPNNPTDVDGRNLEMFAWDNTQKRNVFYLLSPVEGSDTKVRVEVEPKECERCHRNSKSLDDVGMPMVPIMNELVTPWPHWNAQPDFPNHTFTLPESVKTAKTYARLTDGKHLGSAADLEQFIRALQTNRVIPERLKRRRDKPATVEAAMALLRPMFCAEQVNYLTEDHGSSVIPIDVAISGGIRDMFLAIQPTGWPWEWVNGGRMRFASSTTEPLTMIPVRGNLDVEYVKRLVAVRGIDAEKVLRVQALDWSKPVFSDFRCDLWKDARARLRVNPPTITGDMRNSTLFPILYDEIMKLDGETSLVTTTDDGIATKLVVLADADTDLATLRTSIEDGTLGDSSCDGTTGFCLADLNSLGTLLNDRVRALEAGGREQLKFEAVRRFCIVREDFPNRPALPEGSCEAKPRDATPMNETTSGGAESGSDFIQPASAVSDEVRLIPDGNNQGVMSSVEVQDGTHTTFVASLQVRVRIDHSWRGDIAIALRAPDGSEVPVAKFDVTDSANDIEEAFQVFGVDPMVEAPGTWTLVVSDLAAGERGHILGWSLGINTEAPALLRDETRPDPQDL